MRDPQPPGTVLRLVLLALAIAVVSTYAVGAPPAPAGFYSTPFEKRPSPVALEALGRAMFFDATLSASGRMSCASCHDPAHAFGPPNALPVQLGGPTMKLPGVRAVPSLRYIQTVPPFTEHYQETDGNDSEDQGPAGGNNWDGRAQTKHDQARIPLLSPFEMANRDEAAVVERLRKSPYAGRFRETFGAHVLDDTATGFRAATFALEVFQQSPKDFYPYTSRYDAYLRKQGTLTEQELRGLALFADANKGNCTSCHPATIREGAFPAFSDFGYSALGVPRNPRIPANGDPKYVDLGLCGPLRTDLAKRTEYCGLFRVPGLRNVAVRQSFFHNGGVHTLEDAVRFYVERDTKPARWYPTRNGRVVRTDDLPKRYQENLESDLPFGRPADGKPRLDDREIADIVAFLKTLTDADMLGVASTKSR